MRAERPKKPQAKLTVCHPINTGGTTWLKESDLVFIKKQPIAVLSWAPGKHGEVPEVWLPLKTKLLKHDRGDAVHYRYEGEIEDPRSRPQTG